MKPYTGRRSMPGIPGFAQNGAMQLIVACGAAFIIVKFTWICFIVYNQRPLADALNQYIGLAPLSEISHRWWTVLTYGFVHATFWNYLSNMLWLYCFASVLQGLVGHRQVVPLFIYGAVVGGLFGVGSQYLSLPGFGQSGGPVLTAQAGIMAMAAAALTLAPRYRIYLGETFSIPLWLIAGIFILLNVAAYSGSHGVMLALSVGGALMGVLYMRLLQNGRKPGAWMYALRDKADRWATPDEDRPRARRNEVLRYETRPGEVSQKRIDDILEKIHQKGYSSLSKEEREVLLRASKDGAGKQ